MRRGVIWDSRVYPTDPSRYLYFAFREVESWTSVAKAAQGFGGAEFPTSDLLCVKHLSEPLEASVLG